MPRPRAARQAWKAARDAAKESETRKKRGLDESDDVPVPSPQLAELGGQFFAQHKMAHPAELEPSEALINGISRKLGRRATLRAGRKGGGELAPLIRARAVGRRQLSMINAWKVRTLLSTERAARKRSELVMLNSFMTKKGTRTRLRI